MSAESTDGTERNGTAVICQDCPYQDVWYPVRTERQKCKHDLVHEGHTVEYTDPEELSKVVTMDGEVVKRLDEQAELVTDGGSVEGDTEQRDPTEDPAACSICGVHIGAFGSDYCDGCAREIGEKPPLERCMHCGQRAPRNHMESVDISPEDEYYPEIRYFCPDCSGGESP